MFQLDWNSFLVLEQSVLLFSYKYLIIAIVERTGRFGQDLSIIIAVLSGNILFDTIYQTEEQSVQQWTVNRL